MKWIAIEEKLPEIGENVLVTIKVADRFHFTEVARYGKPMFKNKICFYATDIEWGDYEINGVTAWMPLPEPYLG